MRLEETAPLDYAHSFEVRLFMALEPETRLGGYEIVALLGAGGMGEVYLARDTELKRDVAIKVLLEEFVRDSERVARFEREARMVAQVTHPNVGVIHDLKRDGSLIYLVLELVSGETLAEKLRHGPLPVGKALGVFRQIALALEAAHARGIIHRDLKPENVKITSDGVVKVLDFGLAKEIFDSTPKDDSETQTGPVKITDNRTIVGTVAYMSPEQARCQPLDKRTDIWSFGCCLYEALSGRRPFEGKSVTDVLAAVVKEEPDFSVLPHEIPPDILKLLKRCLRKDPSQRLRDIGDARLEIESALEAPEVPAVERSRAFPREWAALAVVAFGAGLLLDRLFSADVAPPHEAVHRFTLELPPTEPVALDAAPALAVASDGSSFVYTVRRGDGTELRRRAMNRLEPVRLAGTEGASGPFFRFGSEELGFFARSQLHRLSPGDFSTVRLAESPNPRGASWVGDRILFSPRTEGGLSIMASRGSSPATLTELIVEKGERSHRWPSTLPDARHALFTVWNEEGFDVELVDLESRERKLLVKDGSYARFVPPGYLVFVRDFALMVQAFDLEKLELAGEPMQKEEDVHFDGLTGAAFYDVSSNGTLVYAPREEDREEASGRILAIDREGAERPLSPISRAYQVPRLSPSGRSLLTLLTDGDSTDVWSMDVSRGTLSRVTSDGHAAAAVWLDESRIAFSSQREGASIIFSKFIESSEPESRLAESANPLFPTSWSRNGSRLAFVEYHPDTGFDVWIWSAKTERSEPFLRSPSEESAAVFSPDGRFLAYVSNETGEDEVYVRPVDDSSGKWRISTEGGREPAWSGDGGKLFYRDEEWMMAVVIDAAGGFEPRVPGRLFEAPFAEAVAPYATYDVFPNGSEFVMVRTDEGLEAKRLVVVTNWVSELRETVPAPN